MKKIILLQYVHFSYYKKSETQHNAKRGKDKDRKKKKIRSTGQGSVGTLENELNTTVETTSEVATTEDVIGKYSSLNFEN